MITLACLLVTFLFALFFLAPLPPLSRRRRDAPEGERREDHPEARNWFRADYPYAYATFRVAEEAV